MWQYLPVLFLLACPLMMIFMMRGMGGGMNHGSMNHGADSQPHQDGATDAPQRIAALEAEVAALRSHQARTEHRDGARTS
jgi:hypothetical protein